MSLNVSADSRDLVVLDETGSDSSPESDVQIIDDEEPQPQPALNSESSNSALLQKLKETQAENASLKEKLNNLLNSKDRLVIGRLDDPVVTIHFTKEGYATKYRAQMEDFLKNLLTPESDVEITEVKSADSLFYVDTKARSSKHKSRHSRYPIYLKGITDVMTDEVVPEKKVPEVLEKPRNSCFNCGGDHLVNECSKPIDRQQIAINRKSFHNKFGGRQNRYHVDVESQNVKFKPGVLSADLRRALNLTENQLPLHIYRMRVLGYPPGWLSEARVESSGIIMYDSHGKAVAEVDDVEEGEVSDGSIRIQFDPEKLVDYPGFNTFPQSGVVDEYEALGFPPMNECQLKSSFVQRMKPPQATPYKRKRDKEPTQSNKKPRIEVDMEIDEIESTEPDILTANEDFNSKESSQHTEDLTLLPEVTNSNDGDCQESQTSVETEVARERPPSPSLEDLEKQKNQLMEQLDSGESSNSQPSTSFCSSPHVTRSKSVSLGTPIPEGCSPFKNLPDASKFSASITEHMNFENLPDSVGSYNKMKALLETIRRRSLQ